MILKRNNWLVVKMIVLITIIIPVGITAYQLVILGKESVLFLGDYPSFIGVSVMIYYALLFVAGIIWIIIQFKSLMILKNEKAKTELMLLKKSGESSFLF